MANNIIKKNKVVFLRRLPKNMGWGGCENRLYTYLLNVDYSNNEIILATTHDVISKKLMERNIHINVENLTLSFSSNFRKRFFEMLNYLRRMKPNKIIFVQGSFTDFNLADFLAGFMASKGNLLSIEVLGAFAPLKKESKKHFGFIKGIGLWWYKELLSHAIKGHLCKMTLTSSREVKKRLVKWYKYPNKKVIPVFFGIDTSYFKKNNETRIAIRKEFGIADYKTVLICTSRLSKQKRIDRLIEACSDKDLNNIYLLIIGDGQEKEMLEKLVIRNDIKFKVKFLGFKEDIFPYLCAGDIFVLPSDIEGLGHSLLEAMSMELICIATKNPGPNEVIANGKTGFLIEKCATELNKKIKEALSLSASDKNRIVGNARETIINNFELSEKVSFALKMLKLK